MPEDSSKSGFADSVALATLVGAILRVWYAVAAHPPAAHLQGETLDAVNRAFGMIDPHLPQRWAGLSSGLVSICALTIQWFHEVGGSVELLTPVQALLSAATPLLVALAFKRWRFAAALAWVLALDPFAIASTGLFVPTCYVGFFAALALALLTSDRPGSWFASGLALATAAWFQPWSGDMWRSLVPGWHAAYLAAGLVAAIAVQRWVARLPAPDSRPRPLLAAGAVVLAALYMTSPLWLGFWFGSHEWDRYLARLVEYVRNWRDWQLFPRWCPDCYGGYGSPLFDFQPPGVFAPSAIGVLLGLGINTAYKVTMALAACVGGLGTFLLVRGETDRSDAAVVGALAFVFAPYQCMNLFMRGDLSEVVALSLFPMTFWLYRLLLRAPLERLPAIGFAAMLCHAGIVLGHTITGQWTTEILAVFLLPGAIGALRRREFRRVLVGLATLTASMGLSAIYVIPALIEKKLVYLERITTGYFEATRHLVPAWRFFRFWFYEFVEDGFDGDKVRMPFFVGVPVVLGLLLAGWLLLKKRSRPGLWKALPWWLGFAVVLWIMTPQSARVWRFLPLAGFIEFPWRLLGSASLLGAAAVGVTWAAAVPRESRHRIRWAVGAAGLTILTAVPMDRVSGYIGPDGLRLTAADVQRPVDQGMTSADEHLPRVVTDVPKGPRKQLWTRGSGQVEVVVSQLAGTTYGVHLDARRAPADVDLAVNWFVGWKVKTSSGPAPIELQTSPKGLLRLHVPAPGIYEGRVFFDGTPARTAGTAVSLFFLLLLYPVLRLLVWRRPAPGVRSIEPQEPTEFETQVALSGTGP